MDEFDQFLALSTGRLNLIDPPYSPPVCPNSQTCSSRVSLPQDSFLPSPHRETRTPRCPCVQGSPQTSTEDTTQTGATDDTPTQQVLSSSLHGLGEDWELGETRPRAQTMPERGNINRMRPPRLAQLRRRHEELLYHRVRAFNLTSKGQLVKAGERYVSSTGTSKVNSTESLSTDTELIRVLLLGASGVGKRALIREFIDPNTSNHPFNSLGRSTYIRFIN